MRLVFLGSPAFALPSLAALDAAGHQIGLVVTQPDRPAGRGRRPSPPPVAAYAAEHHLPVWQTATLKGAEAEQRLAAVGAEAMALAAFGALVPDAILRLAPLGILNVHPSLLPRWRGAAPIQSALLAGDLETGVSIIRLVHALDAGPILLQERVPLTPEDDFVSLEPRLAQLGSRLLLRALAEQPPGQPQDDTAATYSRRITRDDARIDWSQSAGSIHNQVRAYRAWPQAFTTFDARLLKVLRATPLPDDQEARVDASRRSDSQGPHEAAPAPGAVVVRAGAPEVQTGHGRLRLDLVQLEGKRAQPGAELLRGYPRLAGALLGAPAS